MNKFLLCFFLVFILLCSFVVVGDPPHKPKPGKIKPDPDIPNPVVNGSWGDWSGWWVVFFEEDEMPSPVVSWIHLGFGGVVIVEDSFVPVVGVWGVWSGYWVIVNDLEVDVVENSKSVKVCW